jgi:hypothetical protein
MKMREFNHKHSKQPLLALCSLVLLFLFQSGTYVEAKTSEQNRESRGGLARISITLPGHSKSLKLYDGSYALLIGNSQYGSESGFLSLDSVPQELNEIERVLRLHHFEVRRIEEGNKREIEQAVDQFIENYGYDLDNRLLIYYSGHGETVEQRGFLIPREGMSWQQAVVTGQEKEFKRKALKMETVKSWTRKAESKHLLMLFDSCFSGSIFATRSGIQRPSHISTSVQKRVREYITSGSAGEEVPAISSFATSLVHALEDGKADLFRDGYITGAELGLYLHSEVSRNKIQTPQHGKDNDPYYRGGDFIFVLDQGSEQTISPKIKENGEVSPEYQVEDNFIEVSSIQTPSEKFVLQT